MSGMTSVRDKLFDMLDDDLYHDLYIGNINRKDWKVVPAMTWSNGFVRPLMPAAEWGEGIEGNVLAQIEEDLYSDNFY